MSSCQICGAPTASKDSKFKGLYCSRKCAGRAAGRTVKKSRLNPPKAAACERCGKPFETYHRRTRFCSRQCGAWGRSKAKRSGGGVDQNQAEIVEALRAAGASVLETNRPRPNATCAGSRSGPCARTDLPGS